MSETMTSSPDVATVDVLREQLSGMVAAPPEADPARPAYNAMHASTPEITVRASGTADVIEAVRHAREHGMPIAIRGGGHSIAGLSSPTAGMLIDLADLRGVHVDAGRRRAVVQGGALWSDVDRETQAFGLVAPGGVVSDTGVAGLTLGGGYGWVRRRYGLSVDQLVEAQVVTADGRVVTASADEHPDLFWALRGGGGNFGVVTSFTFALQPLGPIVAFSATVYPIEETAAVAAGWRAYTATAPDEVTALLVTLTFPPDPEMPPAIQGRAVVIAAAVYAGDADEGMRVTAPLRELGTVLADLSAPTPYTHVQSGFDAFFPRGGMRSYWKSHYVDDLGDDAIATIARLAQERPAPLTMLAVLQMGGAIARTDPEATAFAQRSAAHLVSIDGNWSDAADDDAIVAWVRRAWDDMAPFGTGGVYLNYMGRADEAPSAAVHSAVGRNLRRLQRVKASYDPDNVFRLNNNILPAP
jgi:FAD/FMN-containing dehydrogenase